MIACDTDTLSMCFRYEADYGVVCSLDEIQEIMIFDRFKTVMVVMLSSICCFGVSDDLSSRYSRMILCRMDIKTYCLSKIVMNAAAVISATVLGFLLFIIVMLPIMPVLNRDTGGYGYLDYFANTQFPWVVAVFWAVIFALFIVFLTTFSMWMTVYRPSRYTAIAIPFGVFYLLYALTTAPQIMAMNMWYISSGVDVLNVRGNFWLGFGYVVVLFGGLTVCCGWGFYRAMIRKMKEGNI